MAFLSTDIEITEHAPISTWFGVGGSADRFAVPGSLDALKRCRDVDPNFAVLGNGANLLVCDEGIDRLVVSLRDSAFSQCVFCDDGDDRIVRAGAGMSLPKLIKLCAREGWAGIEGLAGFPATIGGAIVMNAGGAFGEIGDCVHSVSLLCKDNVIRTLHRDGIEFGYRSTRFGNPSHADFEHAVVTEIELKLTADDPEALRQRRLDAMEYKARTQPFAESSAGCCFKNPTLARDIDSIGHAGQRVSAGMLIDRAGMKGQSVRSATVSPLHANFICAAKNGCAADVIELMCVVEAEVMDAFGISLQRELVVWERSQ